MIPEDELLAKARARWNRIKGRTVQLLDGDLLQLDRQSYAALQLLPDLIALAEQQAADLAQARQQIDKLEAAFLKAYALAGWADEALDWVSYPENGSPKWEQKAREALEAIRK